MLVNYSRSGPTIFPEIRYSVYRAKDSDIEASKLLQAGECPLGGEDAKHASRPDEDPVGRQDFSGSAVDPEDDRAIWFIQPYAAKSSTASGAYKLKVGRVVIAK